MPLKLHPLPEPSALSASAVPLLRSVGHHWSRRDIFFRRNKLRPLRGKRDGSGKEWRRLGKDRVHKAGTAAVRKWILCLSFFCPKAFLEPGQLLRTNSGNPYHRKLFENYYFHKTHLD